MATNSLSLRFKMLGDASGLTKATKRASSDLTTLGKKTNKISSGMKSAIAGIGLGLSLGGVISYLKTAAEGAELARQADARILQVAKSMKLFGTSVNDVTGRLSKYADKLELSTGVTAETTKSIQSTLLTFGSVGKTADKVGGIFDRATLAAMDLAAAGFGTAEGNAVQLGKALNDPIKGLASLAKSGVTFTAKEKDRIKVLVNSNKLGKAQELVLAAIEKQVGGVAEKTALASVKMQNALGQISDEIGSALLPYLDEFAKWATSAEGQKEIQKFAQDMKNLVVEAGKFAKWALENKGVLIGIATAIAGLKVGKGVIDSYKTLLDVWKGLVKFGNLIKPPDGLGGVGKPQGPTAPGGKAPTAGKPTGGGGKAPTGGAPGGATGATGLAAAALPIAASAAAIVAMKAQSYGGVNGQKNALEDVKRAQREYGKYYSATELLIATGIKKVSSISAGGSNMSTIGLNAPAKPITQTNNYTINVSNPMPSAEDILNKIKALDRRKGRGVDLTGKYGI